MKKIINGKLYNTETARERGSWSNTGDWRDFSHITETLYQKRSGEFFLFGEGGPRTKYAVSQGQNTWSGGSKIIPMSADAAREWAEEHLSAEEYEDIFGEVAEDDTRTVLSISISSSSAECARRAAAEAGIPLSSYIESLILSAPKSI